MIGFSYAQTVLTLCHLHVNRHRLDIVFFKEQLPLLAGMFDSGFVAYEFARFVVVGWTVFLGLLDGGKFEDIWVDVASIERGLISRKGLIVNVRSCCCGQR